MDQYMSFWYLWHMHTKSSNLFVTNGIPLSYPGNFVSGGLDPIAFQGGSIPVFLRRPIATCDFRGSSGPPCPPSGSTHVCHMKVVIFCIAKVQATWLIYNPLMCIRQYPSSFSRKIRLEFAYDSAGR